jgi:DNA-binding GntR family transcriptional regulator
MTRMNAVEERLRQMILDLEIGPGEQLSERGMEQTLGASRTPVRSALQRLEQEGLVRREGRGWVVSPLDLDELEQLFVYREVLETAGLRLAAPRLDDTSLSEISAMLDSCGPDATPEQVYQAGLDFHLLLARLSGNDFLLRAVADTMTKLSRARWLETNPKHPGWKEHRAMLKAMRLGKTEEAVSLLTSHIRGSRDRTLNALAASRRSLRSRGVRVN